MSLGRSGAAGARHGLGSELWYSILRDARTDNQTKNPQPCCPNPALAEGLSAGSACSVVSVVPGHGSLHCWRMRLGRAVVRAGPDCPGLQHALSVSSALLLYFFHVSGFFFVLFLGFFLHLSSPAFSMSIASPLALLVCSFPALLIRTSLADPLLQPRDLPELGRQVPRRHPQIGRSPHSHPLILPAQG